MSIGDSGIGTVGPTGEVKGWMVTGVNVSDHVGGTVGRAEGGTEAGAEGIDRQIGGAEVDGESGKSTGPVGEAEGGVDGERRWVPQMISRQQLWNGSTKLANEIAANAKMRLPRLSVLRMHDAKMRLSRLIG